MSDTPKEKETPEAPAPEPQETPQTPPVAPKSEPPATPPPAPAPEPQTPVQSVTPDQLAAATQAAEEAKAKADALELELNRERVARKFNIPESLMGMLRADSLEADAKALSEHVAAPKSGLGVGGLDPSDKSDPAAEGKSIADRLFARRNPFN
ncbi:hypothetical protein [Streptomyces sp. NPDC002644]